MFRRNKHRTDEQLMQQVQQGQDAAFRLLYERYRERVYSYFFRMLYQDEALAADFSQQLFLQLVERRSSFDSNRSFATWLFSLAANLCKNEYRRQERKQRATQNLPPSTTSFTIDLAELDRAYWQRLLSQAIDNLSPLHRQCFLLRHQENYSVEVIAEILDCPVGTVKSRLFYANKQLAKVLANVKSI